MLNKTRCPVCGHCTQELYYKGHCRHAVGPDKEYAPTLHADRRAANIAAGWLPDDGRDVERRELYETMLLTPPEPRGAKLRQRLSCQLPL